MTDDHHRLTTEETPFGTLFLKPGMRGYPELPPGASELAGALSSAPSGRFVDASGSGGLIGLAAVAAGVAAGEVVESSRAALICAERTLADSPLRPRACLPWEVAPASTHELALLPPAERGNARVAAELRAGAVALEPGGVLHLALHKDGGAKRYARGLGELFERVDIVQRNRGWRVLRAQGPHAVLLDGAPDQGAAGGSEPWLPFEAAGLELTSLAGVHSAGRLDPGTALLIDQVPWPVLAGRRVLDLGCGSGVLALLAARASADVTACDDDLSAVRSTEENGRRLGLPVRVVHSDVDSDLPAGSFDVILCNPPFHVGRGVRLQVPRAFLAASYRLLVDGGELWLVANRELPYEGWLREWREVHRVRDERGFKVLRAVR